MYHVVIEAFSDLLKTDYVVIGAGVAGMRAAIELAREGRVLVVAKDSLRESSSEYAQGGIAVALSDEDDISLHEADTLAAGDGLCNAGAVHTLVSEGPDEIRRLIDWGAEFDRSGGHLDFAREGAHSRSRVLHSHGDSTGREIARALYHVASSLPNVTFRGFSAVADLGVPRVHFGTATRSLLGDLLAAGADVVGVAADIGLDEANLLLGGSVPLQGNLDPALLAADWPTLEAAARDVVRRGSAAPGHVFNLGHGVPPDTDPDTLTRLVELVHSIPPQES